LTSLQRHSFEFLSLQRQLRVTNGSDRPARKKKECATNVVELTKIAEALVTPVVANWLQVPRVRVQEPSN
jgi:hypothetical protein